MDIKYSIIGGPNTGKTLMLRCLIRLLLCNDRTEFVLVKQARGSFSFYPKPRDSINTIFGKAADLRVVIGIRYADGILLIAICTQGDTVKEVEPNWQLFNSNVLSYIPEQYRKSVITPEYSICISPCWPSGSSYECESSWLKTRLSSHLPRGVYYGQIRAATQLYIRLLDKPRNFGLQDYEVSENECIEFINDNLLANKRNPVSMECVTRAISRAHIIYQIINPFIH